MEVDSNPSSSQRLLSHFNENLAAKRVLRKALSLKLMLSLCLSLTLMPIRVRRGVGTNKPP